MVIRSTSKQRLSVLQKIVAQIAISTGENRERVIDILSSRKKTDITQLWTTILVPREKDRKMVEGLRTKMIVRLRKGDGIGEAQFEAFKTLYELISQTELTLKYDQ